MADGIYSRRIKKFRVDYDALELILVNAGKIRTARIRSFTGILPDTVSPIPADFEVVGFSPADIDSLRGNFLNIYAKSETFECVNEGEVVPDGGSIEIEISRRSHADLERLLSEAHDQRKEIYDHCGIGH